MTRSGDVPGRSAVLTHQPGAGLLPVQFVFNPIEPFLYLTISPFLPRGEQYDRKQRRHEQNYDYNVAYHGAPPSFAISILANIYMPSK